MNQQQQQKAENERLIDLCTQKLEKEPSHKKALLLRASTYIKMGELDKAESDAYSIINIDPKNSAAFFLLGCIYEKKDQYEQSIQFLTNAIDMDPDNVKALFFRGAVYNTLGYFQKAIDDYDLALQKDSLRVGRKNVYKNIGKVLGINNNDGRDYGGYGIENENNGSDIDKEINNYIYNQFKTLSIKNKNDAVMMKGDHFNIIQNENNDKQGYSSIKLGGSGSTANEREVHEIIDPVAEIKNLKVKGNQTTNKVNAGKFMNYSNDNNVIKNMNPNIQNKIPYGQKFPSGQGKENNNPSNYQNMQKQSMLSYNLNPQTPSNITNSLNPMSNDFSGYSYQKGSVTIKPNMTAINNSNVNNEVLQSNLMCSHEDFPDNEIPQNQQQNIVNDNSFHLSPGNRFQSDKTVATISQFGNNNKKYEKWEILHNQGYAARKSENFPLAIEYYSKAINLNPKYFKALFNRGFAYDKLGQYDNAINDYTRAIEVNPNSAYAYYNRAISYDKKGGTRKNIR